MWYSNDVHRKNLSLWACHLSASCWPALRGESRGNMGGRPGGSMNSSFFIGGEKAQLTKDKKWTVNTLNKAQQTYKNKVSLFLCLYAPLSFSLTSSQSPHPSLLHTHSRPLPLQKEGSELTKCQLTLNVCPSHLPLWTADSSSVWVNTKDLQRIIILLAPSPVLSLSYPFILFSMGWFYSSMHSQRVI